MRKASLWNLTSFTYGIAAAEGQWNMVLEEWIIHVAWLKREIGFDQIYIKHDNNSAI